MSPSKRIIYAFIFCYLISSSYCGINYIIVKAGDASSLISSLSTANSKASESSRSYIFIPNGTYDFGTKVATVVSSYVSLIGQSRDKVIIKTKSEDGVPDNATLLGKGQEIYIQDLTLRVTVNGRGQSWKDSGTKNILKNVFLDATQDTYQSNGPEGMLGYFEGGIIKGTVDFICGRGTIFFDSVTLFCTNTETRTKGNVITAPATKASEKGYVFNKCTIDGDSSQEGTYHLGRPWHESPASTWINTNLKINSSADGWTKMSSGLKLRFHEYNTSYNGKVITTHNLKACEGSSDSDKLYLSSDNGYSMKEVLGSWADIAKKNTAQVNAPEPKFDGNKLYWSAVNGAQAYLIEKNGNFVAITNEVFYEVKETGSYTVRSANTMGGFGSPCSAVKH